VLLLGDTDAKQQLAGAGLSRRGRVLFKTSSATGGSGAGPATLERTAGIKGRILCIFGENDGYIPASEVAAIRKALETSKVRYEVVVYPGVGHGFFCDARADYHATSAADAWGRVKSLFREELA
jgi:carboxymethylenebutenolidase